MFSKFFGRNGHSLLVEVESEKMAIGSDGSGDGVRQRSASSAGLTHNTARLEVQLSADERYVSGIEDLCSVRKRQCPELGGRVEQMDEAFGTVEERAVRPANEVGVAESAELGLKHLAGLDSDRVDLSRTQVYE